MNDVLSVIVPVHNVEQYLPQCLDSILSQDYNALEVLLIDDGSTDSSDAICDTYAARDSRVKVVHQKCAGAAAAKNTGLRMATGEYLSFVDGDDYLEPGSCRYMVNLLEQEQADAVQCALRRVYQDQTVDLVFHPGRQVVDNVAFLDRFLQDWSCAITTNKLCRRRLYDGVFFVPDHFIDDEFFTYQGFLKPCRVVLDDRIIYNYRQRVTSITHRGDIGEHKLLDCVEALDQRRRLVASRYPKLKAGFDREYLKMLLYLSRYPEATAVNIKNHRKRALAYFSSGGALFCSPVTWLEVAELLLLPPGFFLKRKTAPEPVEGVLFP